MNIEKSDINGTLGDIEIKILRENSINLKGAMAQNIKLGEGVNVSNTGSTFNINKTIDTKKTAADIEVN